MRPLYDGRRSPARLRRVEPRFFASPDAFRAWLDARKHATVGSPR